MPKGKKISILIFFLTLFSFANFAQSQEPVPRPRIANNPQQIESAKKDEAGNVNQYKINKLFAATKEIEAISANHENKDHTKAGDGEFLKVVKAVVDGESDLPAILLGIVVAYLTILISVAIAIFSEKKEFDALDRNVILDHILKAKSLLLYLGLTFFPLLFWNGSLPTTRLVEIFFWIIGVVFITKILINSYYWMKGNKFRLRFGYLRKLRNRQDMEEAWRSVWQTENINYQNEQEFFRIFQSTVNRLLENDGR